MGLNVPSRATLAEFPNDVLQELFGDVAREYAGRVVEGEADLAPFASGTALTATESLVVAGQILRAAEISSFELASILNI